MNDTTMPATEAEIEAMDAPERQSYELAFHVLPTVAEGEVATVFTALKDLVTEHGGELFAEETPERFELAYEIIKLLEGKKRAFSSAYFGWIRFQCEASQAVEINEAMSTRSEILRHVLIRLTRQEEEHAFYFHEALASEKMVTTVEESEITPEKTPVAPKADSGDNKTESSAETATDDNQAEPETPKKDDA